jgi:hypothetical protein
MVTNVESTAYNVRLTVLCSVLLHLSSIQRMSIFLPPNNYLRGDGALNPILLQRLRSRNLSAALQFQGQRSVSSFSNHISLCNERIPSFICADSSENGSQCG